MIEIVHENYSRFRAYVSPQIVYDVKRFLDGTELRISPEEQLRREFVKLLADNAELGFSGETIIFNVYANGRLFFEDGPEEKHLVTWVMERGVHAENLVLLSAFRKETLKREFLSECCQRFRRVFHTESKEKPLELV